MIAIALQLIKPHNITYTNAQVGTQVGTQVARILYKKTKKTVFNDNFNTYKYTAVTYK